MVNKYFEVEVKPTIPTVASGQHAAFVDNELLFDWYAFDVPKGTSRLIQVSVEVRPKGDSGATMNKFDFELLIAKTLNGAAPPSLGTVGAATSTGVNLGGHMIGFIAGADWLAHEEHIDSTAFTALNRLAIMRTLLTGEPDTGANVGYDRFYVAGIAADAFNFVSSTLINNGDLNGPVMTTSGTDPRLFLAIGDTVAVTTTADTTASKAMGVVKSMTSTSITLEEAFTTGDVVHQDIVYNTAPITLRLQFEK